MRRILCSAAAMFLLAGAAARADDQNREPGAVTEATLEGYRGIWHGQEPTGDEFSFKYSGGLGTYTEKHIPVAIHAPQVDKTFFVFGGVKDDADNLSQRKGRLVVGLGAMDHATGLVSRPTLVHDKETHDPHDNASLAIDPAGHLWVFISGRARARPGWIYRSVKPYDIRTLELVDRGEYTYPQPWYVPERGFLFLFTKYLGGRQLFFKTSADGRTWTEDVQLAAFGGHYQISRRVGQRVATVFNWHPRGNVDQRTNMYYVETNDFGATWRTVDGQTIELPIADVASAALVRDYRAEERLAYFIDMQFDSSGRPVVLLIVSEGWRPGPDRGERIWTLARYMGDRWEYHDVCRSDHNYDVGLLDISGSTWRVLGPTEPGAQPHHTGGDIVLWESDDEGQTWKRIRQLTAGGPLNHTYVRGVIDAKDDFYALWSDGDAAKPSASRFYYCNRACTEVWRLPDTVPPEGARPQRIAQ